MPRLVHHRPCRQDRVLRRCQRRHSAGLHRPAIHDRRVEIYVPIGGNRCPLAGIEQWIVLQRFQRRFDRIQRRTAPVQHRLPGLESFRQSGAIGRVLVRRQVRPVDNPGAAVQGQRPVLFLAQHAIRHVIGPRECRLLDH